ncbi:NUDIX hydrolase, partial [Streptomyces scabiei]|uniref:hypothetical protein n=1 Tax=Streptomyces scabiei TaxID=1930 RepID=UPI0038F658D4
PERDVLLLFFLCTRLPSSPAPAALDVADWQWASRDELQRLPFPEADVAVVAAIAARLATR